MSLDAQPKGPLEIINDCARADKTYLQQKALGSVGAVYLIHRVTCAYCVLSMLGSKIVHIYSAVCTGAEKFWRALFDSQHRLDHRIVTHVENARYWRRGQGKIKRPKLHDMIIPRTDERKRVVDGWNGGDGAHALAGSSVVEWSAVNVHHGRFIRQASTREHRISYAVVDTRILGELQQ